MLTLRAVAATATCALLGCTAGETDDGSGRAAGARPVADSVASAEAPAWYRRARVLDLTDDGRPDTARLVAAGERPDSLRVTLELSVDGEVKHREEWGSSYELALADSARPAREGVDSLLRARLDSVLSSVVVQRLDARGVRLMAEDRAILDSLEPRPTHRVSFSYGYETTVRLAWDAPRRRFVRLWSCC